MWSDNFLDFSISIDGGVVLEPQCLAFSVSLDLDNELDANGIPYLTSGYTTLKGSGEDVAKCSGRLTEP